MPWYLRKGFGTKAFRINLSKGGIGFSTGIPGFRISTNRRGTYINAGRGGLYFRQRIGGPYTGSSLNKPSYSNISANYQSLWLDPRTLTDYECKPIADNINEAVTRPQYFPISFIMSLLIIIGVMVVNVIAGAVLLASAILPLIVIRNNDIERRNIIIPGKSNPVWERLNKGLESLAQADSISGVIYNSGTRNSRLAIGHRAIGFVAKGAPQYLSPETVPYSLCIENGCLIFMPDYLLIQANGQYGAVRYNQVSVSKQFVSVVESDDAPLDAEIIGRTWLHTTKSGAPDRRYSYNPEYPEVKYVEASLRITQHFTLNLLISSRSAADDFVQALSLMTGKPVQTNTPSYADRNSADANTANQSRSQENKQSNPNANERRGQSQEKTYAPPKSDPRNPYEILGISPNSD